MRMRTLSRRLVALAVLAVGAAGCGGDGPKTKVTGSVTYNGKAVEDGYIVFRPADGKGSEAGGPIVGGNYTLSVPEGPKTVFITSSGGPAVQSRPMSSEEASKLKTEPAKKGAGDVVIDPNAKGNNAKVDVKGAEQSLDFALKPGT